MADVIDTAQERADLILAAQIQAARTPAAGISAMFCIDCDVPIPEPRRAALPGVECCLTCQEIKEVKNRLYRGRT